MQTLRSTYPGYFCDGLERAAILRSLTKVRDAVVVIVAPHGGPGTNWALFRARVCQCLGNYQHCCLVFGQVRQVSTSAVLCQNYQLWLLASSCKCRHLVLQAGVVHSLNGLTFTALCFTKNWHNYPFGGGSTLVSATRAQPCLCCVQLAGAVYFDTDQ